MSQLSKTAHGIKLKIAQLFSEFSLSSETRLKKTLARADFINDTGLTQEQTNEFLYSNLSAIILDKEEKDILSELYGLFEKPKQTLKKAAKERGISEEAVKSEQERILAKIKNYFAPGLTGGEKGFVEDLELETKGLSAQEIKTKIHKVVPFFKNQL